MSKTPVKPKQPKYRKPPSAEQMAMVEVMRKAWDAKVVSTLSETGERLTYADISAAVGLSEPMVGLWFTGRERVVSEHAPALAKFLGLNPSEISASYRDTFGRIDALHDDVLALRFAVLGIGRALTAQGVGEDFDAQIRLAGEKFPRFFDKKNGWLALLLGQLAAVPRTAAASSLPAPNRKAASSSSRK